MRYVYPACFYPAQEGGYWVTVPDLPGCCSQGDDLADAMYMASDAAAGWIIAGMENGDSIPCPSKADEILLEQPDGEIHLILVDIDQAMRNAI